MRKLPLIIGLAMLSIGGTIALLSCPMLLVADIFALAAHSYYPGPQAFEH